MSLRFLPLVLMAALTACAPAGTPIAPATATPAASMAPAAQTGIVTGVALAPKVFVGSVLPVGGGNVLPVGGGNLVAGGGGNLVGNNGARLRLLALEQAPVANAEVYLADAAGNPYPSLAAVKTDAEGRFTFPDVPAGYTFMVVVAVKDTGRADKDATLQTLVKSSALGASATVDVASSLVTLAVTQGQGEELGAFNAAAFRTATEATAANLVETELPDLSDRSAVLAKIEALSASIAELKTALEAIRQDLKDIKDSLAKIDEKLDRQPAAPPPPPPGTGGGPEPANGANGGPGICSLPITHRFKLSGTYPTYPLKVEVVTPQGRVVFSGTIPAAGAVAEMAVPEICPNMWRLSTADGKVVKEAPGFTVPANAPTDVTLPF